MNKEKYDSASPVIIPDHILEAAESVHQWARRAGWNGIYEWDSKILSVFHYSFTRKKDDWHPFTKEVPGEMRVVASTSEDL